MCSVEQDDSRTEHEEKRETHQPREPGQEPLVPGCEVNLGAAKRKNHHQRCQKNDPPSELPDRVTQTLGDHVHRSEEHTSELQSR